MDRKKVLFFITKSNYGGAQRYVFDLASTLAHSHDVCVVSGGTGKPGDPAGLLHTKLTGAHIRTHVLTSLGRDISILNDACAFFEFMRLLAEERPQILHVNSSKAAGLGALAARMYNLVATQPVRIVFTVHGWPFWEKRNLLTTWLRYLFSWTTSLLSHATICICEHDAVVARAMWGVKSKVHVVHNGISELGFLSRDEAREELGLTTQLPTVGTIAELTHNKNIEGALRALANLTTPIAYVVIGGGELRQDLESKVQEVTSSSVHFLGFKQDAYRYLRAFDLFLLPSLKEGVPYVILEAQAAGIPIAAAHVGGIAEVIGEYPHTLFTPTNPLDIARAIEEGLALRVSEPNHAHTLDRMCSETLQVYGS